MYQKVFKRVIDFFIALVGLIILSPIILILVFILLFINNGRPFFLQERPGKNQSIFKIIKFKSMTDKKDSKGNLLPNEQRVTKFGSLIRKLSLDEIPQLINILIGDMSLVGPRPLRVHYLPYYTKEEQIRHTVKPGVTGLAQVTGRNTLNWDVKLAKDIEYVENMSFINDIIIIIKTTKKVLNPGNIEFPSDMLDLDELRKQNI